MTTKPLIGRTGIPRDDEHALEQRKPAADRGVQGAGVRSWGAQWGAQLPAPLKRQTAVLRKPGMAPRRAGAPAEVPSRRPDLPAVLVPGRRTERAQVQVPCRSTLPPQPQAQLPEWPTLQEAAQFQAALTTDFDPWQRKAPAVRTQAVRVAVPEPAGFIQPQWQGRPANVPAATLPTPVRRLYKDLNLQITPDTWPAFTNTDVVTRPRKLGAGKCNTVYSVTLRNRDGSTCDAVFKPLGTEERGWVAAATGIPRDDPQIAMRNLGTVSYARKLGMNVVPDTRIAVIEAGPHAQLEGPKLGLVMERAQGMPASKVSLDALDRADVRAEVTKLQLLDHLTGQGDRHGNNYFITFENGRARVIGIDNDQCFGKRLVDPNGIQRANNRTHYGFRGTAMPPVVDTEMASMIGSMTPADVRAMLGDKLSETEVQSSITRLEGVKQHLVILKAQGRIISPSSWSHPFVTSLLHAGNSYVGRERFRAGQAPAFERARARVLARMKLKMQKPSTPPRPIAVW